MYIHAYIYIHMQQSTYIIRMKKFQGKHARMYVHLYLYTRTTAACIQKYSKVQQDRHFDNRPQKI